MKLDTNIKTRFDTNVSQIKVKGKRWYYSNNNLKISITTYLRTIAKGIGFQKWLGNADSYDAAMQYAYMKADRGTTVHDDIQTLIQGGEIILDGMEEWRIKRLKQFEKWWNKYNPTPLLVEVPLFKKDYPYAGTVDLICEIDNKNVIVDWKTGNTYRSHYLQMNSYRVLSDICIDEMWLQRLTNYQTNYVYLPKPEKVPVIDEKLLQSIYDV